MKALIVFGSAFFCTMFWTLLSRILFEAWLPFVAEIAIYVTVSMAVAAAMSHRHGGRGRPQRPSLVLLRGGG